MKVIKNFLQVPPAQSPFLPSHRVLRAFAVLLALLVAASSILSYEAQAATSTETLFVPLKISTLSNRSKLQIDADTALLEITRRSAFSYLPRAQAVEILDYQKQWPPSPQVISKGELFAGYQYIVVGSLTEIGGQLSLDLQLIDPLAPQAIRYYTAQGQSSDQLDTLVGQLAEEIARATSSKDTIASIAPAGNKKIDAGAILRNIETHPGDVYDPAALRRDLKSVFEMGYFDDIRIEVKKAKNGRKVIFHVEEKPVIQSLLYSGLDELKEETVKEVVTIKEQSILNPAQINKDSEAIQYLYKTKGYYNTRVTPEITFPTEDTAVVNFVIEEGDKIYIKDITFQGNQNFDDDELEDVIETNTKGWFSWITDSGLLDRDKLNQDAGRIINFYGNKGFLDARIGDPVVKQEEEWLYITFVIEEGRRFRVGEIDIQGDLIKSKEELLAELEILEEEFVSREILRQDILTITDIYAEQGYANANIRPRIQKSDDSTTIDILIDIDKRELVYVNRITISGNDRTRDNVIRREIEVEEGGIFNAKAMRDSIQNLQYLEFFEEVSVTPEQSFDPSTVDLSVDVTEKSTGRFTIGAGYSSVDKLILMGEIAENNFLGRGDTLALSANVGGTSNRYNIRYHNPRLNDSQLSWGINLFNTEREYDDYTKDSTGGSLSVGYPVWEKWRGYASYSFTDTDLTDVSEDASFIIRESQDINITSAVKFTLRRDTRNRRFGASKGSRNNISVRYAGGPLQGDASFTKIEASSSWFYSLFWDTVFHVKGAAGQAFENEDGGLPVYERFYLGGLRSIRGFESGKVSPRDPVTDERIGGDKMWYTNFEYIFPLLAKQGLNGVAFFDMGNALDDDEDWGFDNYKKSVGLGIRWFSPMGPLRLEWGYNLDPDDDEDQSVWDFTIGGVF